MSSFETALSVAKASIDEILAGSRFASVSIDVIHKYGSEVFDIQRYRVELKSLIEQARKIDTSGVDAIQRGLYIQIGSVFETFFKAYAETVIVRQESATRYELLPIALRKSNVYYTGRVFTKIHEGVSGRLVDFDMYSRNIGTCLPQSEKFKINAEAFTMFVGNCTPDIIDKLMKDCGFTGFTWDEVAKGGNLATLLKESSHRKAGKLARDKVANYLERRNALVHQGAQHQTVSTSDVTETGTFFLALVTAFYDFAKRKFG